MESSDPELMQRLAGGDDLALNVLMSRWSERITSFLFRLTGSHDVAIDLAQETFVKLYQARRRYRPQGQFSTYLFAIASNLARNHARWKKRHPAVSLNAWHANHDRPIDPPDPGPSPAEATHNLERLEAVQQAFSLLPPELREVMSLFIDEGMGYAEIAEISRCSKKAVETRIYRARRMLKDRLRGFDVPGAP
jgi:RNA polymerase sigma-70 factor (ECF subfamily)